MTSTLDLANEFAKVVECERCSTNDCRSLLRDSGENVPQPGFVGTAYWHKRILIVGQNPAITKGAASELADRPYTAALRALRDKKTIVTYEELWRITTEFLPTWRVHQDYFPLIECDLSLQDLAYCNIVRCRTARNGDNVPPNDRVAFRCADAHFSRWVQWLEPRAIIFLGKYAYDRGKEIADRFGVPSDFLNRVRNHPEELRRADRARVAALVRSVIV